jgi:NAD(P)-dependent dehydrogenase (short-subunit alcohol dehydrogenase family)
MEEISLAGHVAVVTGAGKGLGRAVVQEEISGWRNATGPT